MVGGSKRSSVWLDRNPGLLTAFFSATANKRSAQQSQTVCAKKERYCRMLAICWIVFGANENYKSIAHGIIDALLRIGMPFDYIELNKVKFEFNHELFAKGKIKDSDSMCLFEWDSDSPPKVRYEVMHRRISNNEAVCFDQLIENATSNGKFGNEYKMNNMIKAAKYQKDLLCIRVGGRSSASWSFIW